MDCKPAIHVDARALEWASGSYDTLVRSLKAMPYAIEPWRSRFPQLLSILADSPMTLKGNVVARNICVGGSWEEITGNARPHVVSIDNLIDKDPLFVDARKLDFRLKPNSPAFQIGFKPIPIEQIGLYKSPDRASWPVINKP